MRAGTHGGSQVAVIDDIKLKTFKQCRDIMNVGVSTEPLGQLLLTLLLVAVGRRRTVKLIITDEQQLATTRPTHWV